MKNVSSINELKDVVTKAYVDDKTSDIFTSVTDDFLDTTKIGTSSGVVVDTGNGLIRPAISSYTDDFSTKNYMDEDNTSNLVDIENGIAYLPHQATSGGSSSQFVGYDGTTNSAQSATLRSTNFSFTDNVTKFRVTTDFTTPTGLTGFTTLNSQKIINQTISYTANSINAEAFIASNDVTINGTVETWVSQYSSSTPNYRLVTPTTTVSIANTLSYTPSLTDTLNRNSVMEEDINYVYFAYPTSASQYTIVRINKSTLVIDGSNVVVSGTTMQRIDIKAKDNRLHILWTDSGTRTVNYNFINTNSWGSLAGTTQAFVTNSTTTDIMYSCQLVPADGNKMGWVSFTRKSTNSVHFGIIDTTSNTTPYQFKTAPAAASTPTVNLVGCMTISTSSNGIGCMVFDSANNLFYIMTSRNADNGLSGIIINNGQTTTAASLNTSITASPLNSFGKRNMVAILESQSNVHLVWVDSTRINLEYTKLSFASNAMTNLNALGTVLNAGDAGGNEQLITSICQIGSSPFQFRVNTTYYYPANICVYQNFSFRTNIQPIVQAAVGLSSLVNITSGVYKEFTVSATNSTYARFSFIYPINRRGQTTDISFAEPTPLSVELNSYTLEQVTPTPSGSSTGSFTSIPLVTDRIVKSVTLDVTQDKVSGIAGNDITWQVASLGDNWVNINESTTPAWTVEFPEGQYGSQLRVKATLNKGTTANTLTDVPKIYKYVANVKNVVTVSDIYPMQINLMKLGLQVTTLTTANRLGYKNMMIDVFQTDAGVLTYTPFTYSSGTFTNNSGSDQTLTSVQETTDISNVTNIIVIGDAGSGVTYQVRRGDGDTWATVTTETVYTFQSGTPTNKVQLRAIVPNGVSITGWAYLYA